MMRLTGLAPRRVVLSYGVYDRLLPEQLEQLKSLSQMGHDLIIGCASDALCVEMGWRAARSYAERRAALESCRYVGRVIAQDCVAQIRTDIINYNIGLLAMEASWQGSCEELRDLTQVTYLPALAATVDVNDTAWAGFATAR